MRSIDRGAGTRPAAVASSVTDVLDWFEGRRQANTYNTRLIPLAQLSEWNLDLGTGDLVHRSGRFYTVTGLEVANASRSRAQWQQPIILQSEVGILGILLKDIDGEPHCLLQSKMEPGNVNFLELSPTVQATKSNFTQAHGGRAVPYLKYFKDRTRGRVVFDALQSEQGSWFYAKRNRNIVVHTEVEVEEHEDFVWIPLTIIGDLLRVPNLINMDTRTVLSGMLTVRPGNPDDGASAKRVPVQHGSWAESGLPSSAQHGGPAQCADRRQSQQRDATKAEAAGRGRAVADARRHDLA
ncbi:NDP-hexose 2,3-dehydratase family protein [Salinispora arenicola]|uniref:NDP-hexose 2,3-dehydratase family protein n=1 Tax=Salinispora arenicola TaxID=168697 RepID=UPI0020792D5B|nr:NDP-hexose 2,3-dehydratase family protein [Salinispora arenicola]MCN0152519.1 NDP-hexose 2,3-dehydratase family protein [Salinispora arenicola]